MRVRNTFLFSSLLLLFLLQQANAQEWTYPLIKDYGKIHFLPNAEVQPEAKTEYKIIFDLTKSREKDGVNAGLWAMARELNLLTAYHVPAKNIHLVAIVHGGALPLVLSNEAFQKRFGKDNPNLNLLKELTENKVTIYVCGQAATEMQIDVDKELNPYIKLSVSALTTLPYFQMKGYSLIP